MATKISGLFLRSIWRSNNTPKVSNVTQIPRRCMAVFTETGAILNKPEITRFGLGKVVLVAFPFIYMGGTIGKEGAEFLEENELFVPSDDDDDD